MGACVFWRLLSTHTRTTQTTQEHHGFVSHSSPLVVHGLITSWNSSSYLNSAPWCYYSFFLWFFLSSTFFETPSPYSLFSVYCFSPGITLLSILFYLLPCSSTTSTCKTLSLRIHDISSFLRTCARKWTMMTGHITYGFRLAWALCIAWYFSNYSTLYHPFSSFSCLLKFLDRMSPSQAHVVIQSLLGMGEGE